MLSAERRDVQTYGGAQGRMPSRVTPMCAADEAVWLTRLVHGYTLSHMFPLMRANSDQCFWQGPATRAAVSELPMSAA